MKRFTLGILCLAVCALPAVAQDSDPTSGVQNALVAVFDSPIKGEVSGGSVDPVVLNETPHVGSAAFDICEDLSDGTLWVNDLFNGLVHQYDKSLIFLQTVTPALAAGTKTGFAYDPGADTLWIWDNPTLTLHEIDKTGTPTGSTLVTPVSFSGPATIDPGDTPGRIWVEDIGADTIIEIEFLGGGITNSHANPDGSPAFGNGLSYDTNDAFSNPGDLIASSGSINEGGVNRISGGNPSAARPYASIFENILGITTFLNGIQDSINSGKNVVFSVDNANNRILELGEPPAILNCAPGAVNLGGPQPGFFDDMESGQQPHWTVSSTGFGTNDWAIVTSPNARSGQNVWFVADEATIADKFLDLTIDINAPFTDLEFFHTFQFENGFDGGVLEISDDGGATFQDLGASILEGGYNGAISGCCLNPIANRDAWTGGALGTMTRVLVDLSAFDGTTDAIIRWRHGSDFSVPSIGWEVDDVALVDPDDSCSSGPRTDVLFVNRADEVNCFEDDLEPAPEAGFWTVSSTGQGSNDWAAVTSPSGNAESPPTVWFVADEATIADKFLDLTIDINSPCDQLKFFHTFDMETNFDGGVLDVSVDGGATFQDVVDAGGVFVEGGYNGGPISTNFGSPIGGRPAWTGNVLGPMTEVHVDLSALDGTTDAIIRWRHASDSSVNDFGWEVDNIRLVETCANAGNGGEDFTITDISGGDMVTVSMDEPPSRNGDDAPTPAVLYVWLAEPGSADVVEEPKGLGPMCFGHFSISTVTPIKVFNGIGRAFELGPTNKPISIEEGGNTTVGSRAAINGGVTATLQGIIADDCSQGTKRFSVTNGVLVIVP